MIDRNGIVVTVTKNQCLEFGLLSILVTLVLGIYLSNVSFASVAIALTLIAICFPLLFYPFALLWLNLARALSMINTLVMLSLVFFLVVTPMGALRRLTGKDNLGSKKFKMSTKSVMHERNHLYNASDFVHPF